MFLSPRQGDAEEPALQWHHEWCLCDLLVWDNRCAMHHRDAFDPATRRVMHKTMTEGDRPVYQPALAATEAHPRALMGR